MATLRAGKGSLDSVSEWGWLGLDSWPKSGVLQMRCYGSVADGQTFTNAYTLGDATSFELRWNVGQFGANCNGVAGVSTTDQDMDGWSGGNAGNNDMPASSWQFEGDGWGWHNSAHSCSLWDRTGAPVCFGMSGNCWAGGQNCKADRVELWVVG